MQMLYRWYKTLAMAWCLQICVPRPSSRDCQALQNKDHLVQSSEQHPRHAVGNWAVAEILGLHQPMLNGVLGHVQRDTVQVPQRIRPGVTCHNRHGSPLNVPALSHSDSCLDAELQHKLWEGCSRQYKSR